MPLGFVYNGTQYFYVTNQLGDVLGITDDTGDAFVMYSYDEWGNPIQTVTRDNTEEQNKIAQLNPLRYRGYYYDAETGYYYLQSRYYNPEWGRFISADSFDYIDNTARFGFNAYIYCTNNPIMFVDPTGNKYVSPLGEKVGEILSAVFLVIGAAEVDDNFAYLVTGIIINKQESVLDASKWFSNLLNDFKNFKATPLYHKITTQDTNIFKKFWINSTKGVKNAEVELFNSSKITLSYNSGKKVADFMSGLFDKIKNFFNGILSFSALDDTGFYKVVTNLNMSFREVSLEIIEIFEGLFSPLLVSFAQEYKIDITFDEPGPTAFAAALCIPIIIAIMVLKTLGSGGKATV